MENEVLNNETIETAVAVGKTARGFKIAIGVGATALVGYAAYRFIVKPAIAKAKAKKAAETDREPPESQLEIVVEEKTA